MKAYLEPAEITLMESAAANSRDKLLIRLLFHLGCRISEAISLAVDDVDLEQGTVTIQHLKFRSKISCPQCDTRLGKAYTFCPKCGVEVKKTVAKEQAYCRMRTLPLDNDIWALLKDYITRGGPVNKNGRLMIFGINRHRAWQIVSDCAARAGLGDMVNPATGRKCGVSPHRLRDALAVRAMKRDDSGDGLRMLQEQLGHSSFNTTAKYRKIAGEEHRKWCQNLWEELPTQPGPIPRNNICSVVSEPVAAEVLRAGQADLEAYQDKLYGLQAEQDSIRNELQARSAPFHGGMRSGGNTRGISTEELNAKEQELSKSIESLQQSNPTFQVRNDEVALVKASTKTTPWGIPIPDTWDPNDPVFERHPQECECYYNGVLRCSLPCVWAWPPGAKIGDRPYHLRNAEYRSFQTVMSIAGQNTVVLKNMMFMAYMTIMACILSMKCYEIVPLFIRNSGIKPAGKYISHTVNKQRR